MTNLALAPVPLPWQQNQWQLLSDRNQHGRLAHALLLHGTAGVGKGHLARLLASALLCENPQNHLPCNQCHACQLFAAGSHPDFFLASTAYGVSDQSDEEGESKSRKTKKPVTPSKQIKMDCIRALIHFSTHSAHQSGKRIAIIEPAEWLNHNAANALLKTLEEPGEGLFIILVSHQPSRLLPTLRSRCQALLCQTPDHAQSMAWLRHHIAPERAETALAFSQAAPLKALAAVHAEHDLLYREIILTLEACRQREVTYLFAAESLAKHEPVMVLEWWMALVHRQSCMQPAADFIKFNDNLMGARRKAQSTANPNARMLFEALLIDWINVKN
ncbi:MAG TPA: DNA polymerase III subunit delta' [Pseudomonadales bacterium]|nr:DNA polymerase III subunit delta' [Pseudomonadales bacterium]